MTPARSPSAVHLNFLSIVRFHLFNQSFPEETASATNPFYPIDCKSLNRGPGTMQ
jgi:hypothetical protein